MRDPGPLPPPTQALAGERVFRVVSRLRTDVLHGYCWCGERFEAEDPVELWGLLLDHPNRHAS